MPHRLEKPYEPRAFFCKGCGRILGESYREPDARVTQLRVYRQPRDFGEGLDQRALALEIKFVMVQVNDGKVICLRCGAHSDWFANQTAIADIVARKSAAVPVGGA